MKNHNQNRTQQPLNYADMTPASPELVNLMNDLKKAAKEEAAETYQDSPGYQEKARSVSKTFRLPPELAGAFEELCADNRRAFSNAVRRLVQKAVESGKI